MEQTREQWADELRDRADRCLNELQGFIETLERGSDSQSPVIAQIEEFRASLRNAIENLAKHP